MVSLGHFWSILVSIGQSWISQSYLRWDGILLRRLLPPDLLAVLEEDDSIRRERGRQEKAAEAESVSAKPASAKAAQYQFPIPAKKTANPCKKLPICAKNYQTMFIVLSFEHGTIIHFIILFIDHPYCFLMKV